MSMLGKAKPKCTRPRGARGKHKEGKRKSQRMEGVRYVKGCWGDIKSVFSSVNACIKRGVRSGEKKVFFEASGRQNGRTSSTTRLTLGWLFSPARKGHWPRFVQWTMGDHEIMWTTRIIMKLESKRLVDVNQYRTT